METTQSKKRNNIYTLVNIGLIAFLIIIATIGMRGLSASSIGNDLITGKPSPIKNNVMVCAIGQCLFI
ncbi:MAG: hypothetical protein KDF58_06135 [Alphaproteobacteria bacterium]|nr:hypothetical protein [Alphaproteobacteria bacterium]